MSPMRTAIAIITPKIPAHAPLATALRAQPQHMRERDRRRHRRPADRRREVQLLQPAPAVRALQQRAAEPQRQHRKQDLPQPKVKEAVRRKLPHLAARHVRRLKLQQVHQRSGHIPASHPSTAARSRPPHSPAPACAPLPQTAESSSGLCWSAPSVSPPLHFTTSRASVPRRPLPARIILKPIACGNRLCLTNRRAATKTIPGGCAVAFPRARSREGGAK